MLARRINAPKSRDRNTDWRERERVRERDTYNVCMHTCVAAGHTFLIQLHAAGGNDVVVVAARRDVGPTREHKLRTQWALLLASALAFGVCVQMCFKANAFRKTFGRYRNHVIVCKHHTRPTSKIGATTLSCGNYDVLMCVFFRARFTISAQL